MLRKRKGCLLRAIDQLTVRLKDPSMSAQSADIAPYISILRISRNTLLNLTETKQLNAINAFTNSTLNKNL